MRKLLSTEEALEWSENNGTIIYDVTQAVNEKLKEISRKDQKNGDLDSALCRLNLDDDSFLNDGELILGEIIVSTDGYAESDYEFELIRDFEEDVYDAVGDLDVKVVVDGYEVNVEWGDSYADTSGGGSIVTIEAEFTVHKID